MPIKKSVRRTSKAASQGAAADIPTTIKNPDRVAYRRTELIEVATKMFLERGFHNTSIRDIARACSFNVASLYMYVSSKDDILFLVAKDLMTNIAERLAETKLDPTSPHRSLQIGFTNYCQIANRFRRPIRLLYREVDFMPPRARADTIATVSSVIDYFQDIVAKGVASGDFRPVSPRLTALNIVTIAHMIALHTREVRALGDLDFFVKHQLDVIFAGLQGEPNGAAAPAAD
jgi:AcrR family transcriptional regulator